MPGAMDADTLIAMAGLTALGAAVLTGAIWDSPLVSAPARLGRQQRPYGRHAMPVPATSKR
ncbi:hypothetical protein AU186_21000 [Mycobacterium sp. GA-1999]|nr:hypothetical protein AU187_03205 [Mycobacterium sp. IS-1556]KUH83236.1 hypothetical protein AU185_05560 [Mycobacterium sp. GA-0227b]KUH84353.1 hypothetical protein AU186_21000 [Mycobacterium sp. GA-1999]